MSGQALRKEIALLYTLRHANVCSLLGVAVVGGRIGDVGVGGYVLGGKRVFSKVQWVYHDGLCRWIELSVVAVRMGNEQCP